MIRRYQSLSVSCRIVPVTTMTTDLTTGKTSSTMASPALNILEPKCLSVELILEETSPFRRSCYHHDASPQADYFATLALAQHFTDGSPTKNWKSLELVNFGRHVIIASSLPQGMYHVFITARGIQKTIQVLSVQLSPGSCSTYLGKLITPWQILTLFHHDIHGQFHHIIGGTRVREVGTPVKSMKSTIK